MIDVKAILDELGIDYKADGKNVGSNDINIDCPFCGSEKHLGINVVNAYTNCWVCEFDEEEGWPSLIKVLKESTDLDWSEIKNIMKEHGWEESQYNDKDDPLPTECSMPKESYGFKHKTKARGRAMLYLANRGFGTDIINKYNLRVAESGAYINRIIIPIYLNGKLESFTSRDFTGRQQNRYKHASIHYSSTRIKDLLYNYDIAKKYNHLYLLEGPTDVWRIGSNSVAVFKSKLSPNQRNLLLKIGLESITIIYDPNATSRAYDAASQLSPFIRSIKIIRLTGERDVAARSRGEIINLENETAMYRG